MIIETRTANPGKLFVTFEGHDFRLVDRETGSVAWFEAKEAIKEMFPYPKARYDGDLRCWVVEDSPEARQHLEAINKRYFQDENQMELI
jgi:hypothetical protein